MTSPTPTPQTDPLLAAILSAVLADPADDTSRLAYADRLDELAGTGEATARAEFVRVQVALANVGLETLPDGTKVMRTGCPEDDAEEKRLRQRGAELLAAHAGGWADGLPAGFEVARLTWRRGFIAEIESPPQAWREWLLDVLQRHPLEKLTLALVSCADVGWFAFYRKPVGNSSLREIVLRPAGRVSPSDDEIRFAQTQLAEWLPGVDVAARGEPEPGATRADFWRDLAFREPDWQGLFDAAERAGQEAAYRHEQRVLDALLAPDEYRRPPVGSLTAGEESARRYYGRRRRR